MSKQSEVERTKRATTCVLLPPLAYSSRACLLTLAAEDDDGGEKDTTQVGAGVLVVSGGDAAPLLEPAEDALDGVAPAVALRVERGWSAPA